MFKHTFNVLSENYGEWGFEVIDALLLQTFHNIVIVHDATLKPDLVVKSHFYQPSSISNYTCPYITWSGESNRVVHNTTSAPIMEINTINCNVKNSLYFPHLITECKEIRRPKPIEKKYCCSYAYKVSINERENLFRVMRSLEKSCFSFGRSLYTNDNPFESPQIQRWDNYKLFNSFAFNVAMENKIFSGYITEKIGHAFLSGSVPIYWGDTNTVNHFFNSESFINVLDYPNIEKAAQDIIEIYKDKDKYHKYSSSPITINKNLEDYEVLLKGEYRLWQKDFIDTVRFAYPDL